jgi:type VI secretion system protein ImpA
MAAFAQTLTVASGWLETYWQGLYPPIDDPMLRLNALNNFSDKFAIVEALRRLPLVSSRQHGKFSLRDIDIATEQMPPAPGETPKETARIEAAFAEMPLEELTALRQSVGAGLEAIKGIEASIDAKVTSDADVQKMLLDAGDEAELKIKPLTTQLAKIDKLLATYLAARTGTAGDEGLPGEGAGAGGPVVVGVGAIRSRQDAIRALDAVAEFFRQNEPSSPIPLFVERAKRLVSKNFLEVLADIAPDAVPTARSAGGLSQEYAGE